MSGFQKITIEIVVGHDRTSNGGDSHRPLSQPELIQGFGDEPVDDSMRASRTVMRDRIGHGLRALENQIGSHTIP
jgi:hypothetical protein